MTHAINIIKLHPEARTPTFATAGDAGADLYTVNSGVVEAGEFLAVGTGIAMELPMGTVGLIHPRSGLAAKHGVTVLNAPGTIDAGYRGEIKVLLHNVSKAPFFFDEGTRIAQIIVQEHLTPSFVEVEQLTESTRGAGGFGSTGA